MYQSNVDQLANIRQRQVQLNRQTDIIVDAWIPFLEICCHGLKLFSAVFDIISICKTCINMGITMSKNATVNLRRQQLLKVVNCN